MQFAFEPRSGMSTGRMLGLLFCSGMTVATSALRIVKRSVRKLIQPFETWPFDSFGLPLSKLRPLGVRALVQEADHGPVVVPLSPDWEYTP